MEPKEKKPRILVVDDDAAPMMALRWELKGCEIVRASSMSEALLALHSQTFDAVVSDWNLGQGSNAEELLETSRRLNAQCARVVVSGEVPESLASMMISKMVHRFIAKPWSPHDVRQAVMEELAAL